MSNYPSEKSSAFWTFSIASPPASKKCLRWDCGERNLSRQAPSLVRPWPADYASRKATLLNENPDQIKARQMETAMTTTTKPSTRKLSPLFPSSRSVGKSRCEKQVIIWGGWAVSPPIRGENSNIRLSIVMQSAFIRQEQVADADPD